MDGLKSLAIVEVVLLCSGESIIMLDWLRRLTQGWSLMALKISLMGRLNEVKCSSALKAQSGFGERMESTCLLKAGCLRF